jgi:hypothetical protein
MPVSVRKSKRGGYDIVEDGTGKVVGHSTDGRKAHISAAIRNEYIKRQAKKGKR